MPIARLSLLFSVLALPTLSAAAPVFQTSRLFEGGRGGYALYRIPGIVVTKRGTILAYTEARRTGSGDWDSIEILLRRSTDGGATFSAPRIIAHVPGTIERNPVAIERKESKPYDITYNNPVAIADRSGAVHFLFCLEYMRAFYMRSDDDGLTFTSQREITSTFNDFRPEYVSRVLATSPGHGIQLRNGRLLVPVWLSLGTAGNGHHPSVTATIYSDDHGATWHRGDIAVANTPEYPDPNESAAVELADGRVLLNVRTEAKEGRRVVVFSKDGATHWSKPRFREDLPDPVCFASLVRDGSALLFVNPASGSRARINLAVRASYDEGAHWTLKRVIEPGRTGYADLAVLPDGTILCFFESTPKLPDGSLRHDEILARFNFDWLIRPYGGATWSDYNGSPDASQYSTLRQIDRSNVSKLRVAWTYSIADGARYSFSPLEAHGVLYVMAKNNAIVALEAGTGKELWVHENAPGSITTRGIGYWESADGSDRRLFYSNNDMLLAIDARTGQAIESFGLNGRVDLRQGLGRDPAKIAVESLFPGRVFENLIILGSATNQEYDSAPGDIRAYDVRTGALVWTFHTIPHEDEFGYDTWPPEAWKKIGGANDWAEMSLDAQRGIVYVPTASPKYNFYGANRLGANLFGDCLLALDARTGKRLWHFQMVHHDVWDYDNATAPKLLTVTHGAKKVDIVAEAGKTGFLYVFNRVTGRPLWPIEERPVPRSNVPGEQTWPTQPFPVTPPPFARQKFTVDDLNPYIDPAERARIRDEMLSARNEGLFTPPGTSNTVEMPGNNGGANFGGGAVDPERGTMFVVSKDYPAMLKLRPDPKDGRYKTPFGFMVTSTGLSAIAPPWTTLTAYDLNTGKIKWQEPLGDVPELAAKGITNTGSHFPKVGPVVTAGGLIFAGTRDRFVRALDSATGKVIWQTEVGAGLEGIPAVYEVNGREYVVFCAAATSSSHVHASAGHPADHGPVEGAYVAFALPEGAAN